MNDDCYQRKVLRLSYKYVYKKLCALVVLKHKNFKQVAENSIFCVEMTTFETELKCVLIFASECFDVT